MKLSANQILATMMGAVRTFNHSILTKRIAKHIEKSLPEGYSVSYSVDNSNRLMLRVFMPRELLEPKDSSIVVEVKIYDTNSGDWKTRILEAMECDITLDYEERARDEQTLIPRLAELEKDIESSRSLALRMVQDLPVPKASTTRAMHSAWSSPSLELRKQFPNCFGTIDKLR